MLERLTTLPAWFRTRFHFHK